jgi:hypothetical protein
MILNIYSIKYISLFLKSNKPEIINLNRRLDTLEHSHHEAEGNIQTTTNHLADLLSRHTATDTRLRQTEEKIKTDEQTVRDLSARVALLPTTEDLTSVRRDLNDKVCFPYLCFIPLFALLMCLCYIYICLCIRFVTIYKKVFNNMKKIHHRHLLNMNNVLIIYVLI